MHDLVLVLMFWVQLIVSAVVLYKIFRFEDKFAGKFQEQAQTQQVADQRFDERELSAYERERLRRDEEFDERIRRLKEELASKQQIVHQMSVAEELHPLVKNLPHNIIKPSRRSDDETGVEYID